MRKQVVLDICPACGEEKYLDKAVRICSSCHTRYVVNLLGMVVRKAQKGGNTPHKKGPLTHKQPKGIKSPKLGRTVKPGAAEKKTNWKKGRNFQTSKGTFRRSSDGTWTPSTGELPST